MLQQTQVDRVIGYYERFLKKFPTVRALAKAPLGDVLRLWAGLGYNRRAKMLHEAAKEITSIYGSVFPKSYEELVVLPGIGDYTAKAVRVFAFNKPEVVIETNIRSVFIHHFFPRKKKISDSEIVPYMELLMRDKNPRQWYADLMDYGSLLKREVPNPSRRSKHHTKQKAFKGSDREIRGAILKAYLAGTAYTKLPFDRARIKTQLARMRKEGMIT